MIKLIAICKYKKFHIQILGLLFLFVSQSVFAESALQKSLLELKKAIQEQVQKSSGEVNEPTKIEAPQQKASIDDVFGAEVPKQVVEYPFIWKTKAELLNAVAEGAMPEIDLYAHSDVNVNVYMSVAKILRVDYQTPLKVAKGNSICVGRYETIVPYLMLLIKESKFSTLSNQPPSYIEVAGEKVEANNSKGRAQFNDLSDFCSKEVFGRKSPYPFINSLSLLLKEYSQAMEVYVENERSKRVQAYIDEVEKQRVAKIERDLIRAQQKKEAEEFALVTKVEKDIADSKARVAAKQEADKVLRDRQFHDEFKRKEAEREKLCLASAEYGRFTSASIVKENLSQVDYAKKSIKKEKEIGKVSGYEDAGKLNELGRLQIFAQDLVDNAFKEYKKYGGKAFLPSGVVKEKNPCL